MAHGTCSIDGCGNSGLLRRGWCNMHYLRWRRHGDPTFAKTIWGDDEARFWSKVDKTDGCWVWTATVNSNGYGQIKVQGRKVQAHRYAYELMVGPIPDGLFLDHLCRNRACVRPSHVEPVDNRTNTLRGEGVTAVNARRDMCQRGHPLQPRYDRSGRFCPTCQREGDRLRKRAKRATSGGPP